MSAICIDIADGFRDAWAADTTLNGLIPVARCYYLQAPAVTAVPYAVFKIEPAGDPQYSTGVTTYIVDVALKLSIYAAGIVSSLQAPVQAAIALYDSTFTVTATTIMATFLQDAGTVEADGVRDQEQIYRAELNWRLMVKRDDG